MLLSDEKFFTEKLDTSYPGLEGIDETFRTEGLEAAEKRFGDFIRNTLRPQDYLKTPYAEYGRENAWAYGNEDDIAACERVISYNLMSCGYAHQFPYRQVDWKSNPTYNNYREWTWQLSRHNEWRCLGHTYLVTGDERYAEEFVYFLMSWCEQAECPESAGSGATECWRTIEAGIRMTKNWHYAIHCFYKSPHVTDHVLVTFFKSIWEHGYRLRGFGSSGNWLIMEMAGLSHISVLYPWYNDSAAWKEYAFGRLSEEIDVQVYPDGFQYELSTNYHGVVVSNYRYVIEMAQAMGEKIPKCLSDNLERAFELYIKICCPDRSQPDLNDGGTSNIRSACALAHKFFPERKDFLYFATDGKEGELPAYTSIALPYSGMAVMRTDWSKDAVWCFMESAPFGKGHQHEDKLNVLMFAYGKRVLPDSGNYAYDSSEMRKFILDTRSHNCAMVDDKSQNRRKNYKWIPEDINKKSDLGWNFTDAYDTAEGVYDEGYGSDLIPVTHKRKTIFFKKAPGDLKPFALVIDRFFTGDEAEHKYAVSYQTAKFPYEINGKTYVADCGDGVKFSILGAIAPEAIVAQKEPYFMGWRKKNVPKDKEYDHDPVPCLRYIETGKEKRVVTALCPTKDGDVTIKEIIASSDVTDTLVTVVASDGKVIVVDEKDHPVTENV